MDVIESKIRAVMGVGSGDSGYGQTLDIFQNKTGRPVTPVSVPQYKNYMTTAINHQTGGSGNVSATVFPPIVTGDVPDSTLDKYTTASTNLVSTRLNYGASSMTLYSNVFTVVRNYWWGPLATIACEVDALWPNEDQARYFFNSGGDIRLVPSQPTWSWLTGYDYHGNPYSYHSGGYWWNAGLPRLGTILFRAHGTQTTGSVGSAAGNIGYYELSGGYATILNGQNFYNPYSGIPGYSDIDDFFIYAAKVANGVRFRVTFTEANHDQRVDPSTRVTFSYQKATRYLVNPPITSPSFITRTAL